jgi:hypothetical protein
VEPVASGDEDSVVAADEVVGVDVDVDDVLSPPPQAAATSSTGMSSQNARGAIVRRT